MIQGFSLNPAAPQDLLRRLFENHPREFGPALRQRADLPDDIVAAAVRHPSPWTRRAIGSNPSVDPEIRLSLVEDPDGDVALAVVLSPWPGQRWREAVTRHLDHLVALVHAGRRDEQAARVALEELGSEDRRAVALMVAHPAPTVRLAAAGLIGPGRPLWNRLAADDDPRVRADVARREHEATRARGLADFPQKPCHARTDTIVGRRLTPEAVAHLLRTEPASLAYNKYLTPETVAALVAHPDPAVRRPAAYRTDLTRAQVHALIADPDVSVRTAASLHALLGEEIQTTIDIDPSTMDPDILAPVPDDLTESIRLATSVNPLRRRRAARDPRLPAGTVTVLAGDADPQVRMHVALHHPDPPPALLLRVFREDVSRRRALANRIPPDGLSAFAADPDPEFRALALRDPATDPIPLLDDPDPRVRRAAVASPRVPADRLVVMLDDPDPGVADAAAANPALPVPVMVQRAAATARPA
ncbi:hypothetical protein [Catenuloplanes indicus]|uniref:Leucine rich repeat variant n=1 Tax=Catenuloplanes indicus TaxID=137267 RepID=A0AAE3VTY4_9ACTN|nr:hypothetical protein [Catenuloplanes indicus]MDQ0363609.1 hypothetical protein [Catenuloplanes indicus]